MFINLNTQHRIRPQRQLVLWGSRQLRTQPAIQTMDRQPGALVTRPANGIVDNKDNGSPPPAYYLIVARLIPSVNHNQNITIMVWVNREIPRGPRYPQEGMPFSAHTQALLYGDSASKDKDKDDSESEYEENGKKRKRNKNGEPRKVRKPRAFLRQWDEHDVTRALMGIVWACGERGIRLPFDQAAQMVGETCTASALQQAILKIHARLNEEGAQIPKIKMSWPSKAANPPPEGDAGERELVKPDRRRRPETFRKATQSLIVTLKCAYPGSVSQVFQDDAFDQDAFAQDAPNGMDYVPSTPAGTVMSTYGLLTPQHFGTPQNYVSSSPMVPSGGNGSARFGAQSISEPFSVGRQGGVSAYQNRHSYLLDDVDVGGDYLGLMSGGNQYQPNYFGGLDYGDMASGTGLHHGAQANVETDLLGMNLDPQPSALAQNTTNMGGYVSANHEHLTEVDRFIFGTGNVSNGAQYPLFGVRHGRQEFDPEYWVPEEQQIKKEEQE